MALVVNLQRKIKLDLKPLKEFCEQVCRYISDSKDKDFSVAFVSDRRMKELNSFFRGKDSTTDVLSFPHEADEFESSSHAFTYQDDERTTSERVSLAFLGDIVISIE